MSFPRISNVFMHLARRCKSPTKPQAKPIPDTELDSKERELLTERLFAAVRGNTVIAPLGDGE